MGERDSLIHELEDAMQSGSSAKRVTTLRRVTDLFVDSAEELQDEQIALFDDVLSRLVEEIGLRARAELSNRMAPIANAPSNLMRRLANDDGIEVAGPVLSRSERLSDADLIGVAVEKSQRHLLAIAGRRQLGEAVTDVLVDRGNRQVLCKVAENNGAAFSSDGLNGLVQRAEGDDKLTARVGHRDDIPPDLYRKLILHASATVRRDLLRAATREMQEEIQRTVSGVLRDMGVKKATHRDYTFAEARVLAMRDTRNIIGEAELAEFAERKKFEETVIILSLITAVPVEVFDHILSDVRSDPLLIITKAAGFKWQTLRALIQLQRPDVPEVTLLEAEDDFNKLSPSTAERAFRFWQIRNSGTRDVA
ncbi:MAG: DUF2336 domain-containing protein [Xanthobacteraceae bacterium]